MAMPDILAALADDVAEIKGLVSTTVDELVHASDTQAFQDAKDRYREQVRRIASAAEMLSLTGLRQVFDYLDENLTSLALGGISTELNPLLRNWPDLLVGYLLVPKDLARCRALIEPFIGVAWPVPLNPVTAIEIERNLGDIEEAVMEMAEIPNRQTLAQLEDISLELSADINDVLIDAFLTEGPLQASRYSSVIQDVINGDNGGAVAEARRVVHALKGAANTVGVRGVAVLTHHTEDILEYLSVKAIRPDGDMARLLVNVGDCLELMFETLLGLAPAPEQALRVLQDVLDVANRLDRNDVDDLEPPPLLEGVAQEAQAPEIQAQRDKESRARDVVEDSASRTQASAAKVERRVRVTQKSLDELLRISGEFAIGRSHVQERLQHTLKLVSDLRERNAALWRRVSELDALVSIRSITDRRCFVGETRAEEVEIFDPLEMDQYNELHTAVHSLVETIADSQILGDRIVDTLAGVDVGINQQIPLNNSLHEILMKSRLQQVSALEPRFHRTVRQVCDATGKSVALVIEGTDVMVDDQMIDLLIDPLQHVLRNAVDHGIESPEARRQLGKPETGSITLSFIRQGNYLAIKCRDDGSGLDLFRIHSAAVDSGLISESMDLSNAELARLILRPGFTTKKQVTEVSGRGVGMDIVHSNLNKLNGTIDIQFEAGKWCMFTMRLPMAIGMAHCLLVRAGDQTFAIPSDSLDRVVFEGTRNIDRVGTMLAYRDEVDVCPVYSLKTLIGDALEQDIGRDQEPLPVIVARDEKGKNAIVVDSVMSGHDLVIKGMGRYVQSVKGVIGVSILGNGQVVPILDMASILQKSITSTGKGSLPTTDAAGRQSPAISRADILVVDDSLSVRTALSQLLSADGYRVRTAKDGVEALEEITKCRPDAMLVDMEMPRMNGLELLARIRSVADDDHIPVIMVTSRSSAKHKDQALAAGADVYVTKPYREGELLSHVRSMMSKAA